MYFTPILSLFQGKQTRTSQACFILLGSDAQRFICSEHVNYVLLVALSYVEQFHLNFSLFNSRPSLFCCSVSSRYSDINWKNWNHSSWLWDALNPGGQPFRQNINVYLALSCVDQSKSKYSTNSIDFIWWATETKSWKKCCAVLCSVCTIFLEQDMSIRCYYKKRP